MYSVATTMSSNHTRVTSVVDDYAGAHLELGVALEDRLHVVEEPEGVDLEVVARAPAESVEELPLVFIDDELVLNPPAGRRIGAQRPASLPSIQNACSPSWRSGAELALTMNSTHCQTPRGTCAGGSRAKRVSVKRFPSGPWKLFMSFQYV